MGNPRLYPKLRYDVNQNFFWDDDKFPAVGQQLYTPAGRLDFNYTEIGVDFAINARYPEEPLVQTAQMPHGFQLGTEIRPHIHWIQSQAAIPNWLMSYRIWLNGAAKPAYTLAAYTTNIYAYSAGDIMQITLFPTIDCSSIVTTSAFIDIIIYRDSANTSTLFTGADPVAATVTLKEYDHHLPLSKPGTIREFS